MITVTVLFLASLVAVAVLRSQAQSWNSPAPQPIAIPVRDHNRFSKS